MKSEPLSLEEKHAIALRRRIARLQQQLDNLVDQIVLKRSRCASPRIIRIVVKHE